MKMVSDKAIELLTEYSEIYLADRTEENACRLITVIDVVLALAEDREETGDVCDS